MATSLLTGSRFTRRAFKPHFSIIDRGREFIPAWTSSVRSQATCLTLGLSAVPDKSG